jgi:hypothetical protein
MSEITNDDSHTCDVCGYTGLVEAKRAPSGGGSYEICPACGYQFGVDDDDRGIPYEDWRRAWIAEGMPWRSAGIPKPEDWDPEALLKTLESR